MKEIKIMNHEWFDSFFGSGRSFTQAINEAKRPEEGATKIMQETKRVQVRCKYPDPDDGSSYSWVKMGEEDGG